MKGMHERNGALEVESVVLGPSDVSAPLEPWRRLTEEAARVVWQSQTDLGGKLAVALMPGEHPTHHSDDRVVVGAYSPEAHTVLVFIEGLDKVRRTRTYLRQLMRTLAHEVTHAVQHRSQPGTRPGRGSVALDPKSYAEDPLEKAAVSEENAFDHALFSPEPPRDLLGRINAYRSRFTADFVEQIHELETDGS